MKTLKIKKVHEDAFIPKYAHSTDAGMDIFSVEDKLVKAGEIELIRTGIQLELPSNTEAQLRPRSGLALNHGITLLNSPGTIDEGYTGEIKVILINHGKEDFLIKKSMRIAQMVINPVMRVNIIEDGNLIDTTRGDKGFGSTGYF